MRRREFIAALGSAAAWPLAAYGQQQGDQVRALQIRILRTQAEAVANMIGQFIREIEAQVGWTTQLPWSDSTFEQRRFDGSRLLRQVPAITELSQLDATGHEQLRVSRLGRDVIRSNIDYSRDPKFTDAVAHKVYYGPVYFRGRGKPSLPRPWLTPLTSNNDHEPDEPYMTLSIAGTRRDAGVSVAEVGLKLIQDAVTKMKVGEHGGAYVLDARGHVIAHPNVSLIADHEVLAAYASVTPLGWLVFMELPVEDADALAQ
jgi:hypothetical protein